MQTNEYKQKRTYWWEMGVVNTACKCIACRCRSAEKKKNKEKKTYLGVDDGCMRACIQMCCVQTQISINKKRTY